MSDKKKGVMNAAVAYVMWGLYPLYWWQLQRVAPAEILINRMIWSFVTLFLIIVIFKWSDLLRRTIKDLLSDRKRIIFLLLATVLISINWFTYTWSVVSGRVLEAGLGYYISPILSFIIGAFILKEKFNKLQVLAACIATSGVLFQTISYGIVPWISLILASTFAFYGFCKKLIKVDPFMSLFLETTLMLPFASFFFGRLIVGGESTFLIGDGMSILLLIGAGIITVSPLFFFGKATQLAPLKLVGFMQYIGPTIGLFIAIFIFREPFSTTRLITFAIIWLACIVFTISQFNTNSTLK